jgi:hypothetical protein
MAKTTYEFNNIFYTYRPTAKKWEFKADTYTFLCACKGAEVAHKVAKQVAGALKRCQNQGIDNLARANISKVVGN